MLNNLFEIYAREGISLKANGLNDAVIPIKFTLEILDILGELNIIILGGDLYEKDDNGNLVPTYSDWYYEGTSYTESIMEAKKYLLQYQIESNIFVSFVFES